MPSWWERKVLRYGLRYALSWSGLLDDQAIDLDNLDFTLGKKTVIELRDLHLNIKQIVKYAKLPPCLRLETARVLLLRLTLPADVYQSSIVVEIDGLELVAHLEDREDAPTQPASSRNRSPTSARTPQHRKTQRRPRSPPPHNPSDLQDSQDDLHIPTTEEIAQSFLKHEPSQEREELEAMLAGKSRGMEESYASESSEGGNVGIGTGMTVPAFLAGFMQGIVDRFRFDVKNVQVTIETAIPGEANDRIPIALRLKVGAVELDKLDALATDTTDAAGRRRVVDVRDISLELLSDEMVLADLSDLPSHSFSSKSRSFAQSNRDSEESFASAADGGPRRSSPSTNGSPIHDIQSGSKLSTDSSISRHPPSSPEDEIQASVATIDAERFADAGDDDPDALQSRSTELDIQAGDDNISWGSRRSKSNPPSDDLWRSMVSDDDLPDSLIMAPEQGRASRTHSSRGSSPFAMREGRIASPLPSTFRGPGSWPRLDESPQRHRQHQHQGPGSWPALDQSQHSAFEPLAQVLTAADDGITDNKKAALHQVESDHQTPDTFSTTNPASSDEGNEHGAEDEEDDMLKSRVFSHEEAQSMYMSAMTNSPTRHMPGGWGTDTQSELSGSGNEQSIPSASYNGHDDDHASGNNTPRAESPTRPASPKSVSPDPRASHQLFYVDYISVSVPAELYARKSGHPDEEPSPPSYGAQSAQAARAVPGAFSIYSESSKRRGANSMYGEFSSTILTPDKSTAESTTASHESSVEVCVGIVRAQFDIASGRVLYAFATKAAPALSAASSSKTIEKSKPDAVQKPVLPISLRIQRLDLSLKDKIDAQDAGLRHVSPDSSSHGIISLAVMDIGMSVFSSTTRLTLSTLKVLLGGKDLLAFTNGTDLSNSQMSRDDTADIDIIVKRNKTLANNRPVTEIIICTNPIVLLLDLTVIDECFDSFGGLSGMLELGSSILSDSGISSPNATKAPKGVRFAGDMNQPTADPEVKTNVRIAGVTITLKAAPCSAVLQTSAVKAVHREAAGVMSTVERVLLSGPFLHGQGQPDEPPFSIELATTRLEFSPKPNDKDLERLLSLLTPSKDKYDNDDDILIDTLLRQRRKGGLLRTVIGSVKVRVDDLNRLTPLEELSSDLAKLSAVAKYLPEDDRPGLLTLVLIKSAEARLPVNKRFGAARVAFQDLHLAHVGLPALLAFSISNVNASQLDGPDLIHALSPLAGAEGLPMIMARMLGDEEEPTIKIKLFNMCAEYSVPVLLDLTSIDREVEVEELVTGLAESIAGIAMDERTGTAGSDPSSTGGKRTKVSLLVHDSAVGLTPQRIRSKALLVLTDTHFTTIVPPEEKLKATLDLRKASIFITDSMVDRSAIPSRAAVESTSTTQQLASLLTAQGFVSVGSIMSATINVLAEDNGEDGEKTVKIDVKNELVLLETCADSTQTLIATLSALAPPTTPSKQPKYLTEPITIEDMMASFTGDPFTKPDLPPETLFDAEADQDDTDMLLGESGVIETADLLAESEMTSSLYGPISGVFAMDDHDEDESTIGEDYPKTVESLLEEEDPFEMPTALGDMHFDDAALLRDLKRQCQPTTRDEPVTLELYEVEDLGYDALGSSQQALGTQQRFNAPYPGRHGAKKQRSNLPFTLQLRDCHVIWHIYDGYDWQRTRDGISEAVEQVEIKAEERRARRQQSLGDREDDESVVGDLLFNSIYIAVPSDHDAQELRRQINRNIDDMISETESVPVSGMSRPSAYSASGQPRGQRKRRRLKLGRSRNHKIAFELKGVSADVLVYPSGGDIVSSVDLRIRDLEIFDKVPSSTWRKFLTHLETDSSTREMFKPMFHIQMDNVKTLESHSASEIVLKVSVLPLRLHVDQDALDFITRFFEFKDESCAPPGPPAEPPFIQRVEVDTVDMCLDYKPKNIDYVGLRSGRTTEFMNFITLDASNIRLKHAIVYGLRGFDTLHQTLNDVWMPDIQRNQLPTILAGLAPVRSLVNLGSGMRDVIAIPIREYKKDGRIVRSVQKGAFQFGKTTASELARLGAKVALGTQTVLSNAEQFLSPEAATSSRRPISGIRTTDQGWHDIASDDEEPEQRAVSAYANQPLGVLPGLRSARRHLEHDLLTAKDALIAVRGEFFESRGPGGAAAAMARHAPTVILRPIIGATRAVGTTLLGVGNQIDRDNVRKVEDVSSDSVRFVLAFADLSLAEIQATVSVRETIA